MGEVADMMLEGILCQECGVYVDDGGAEGFPRTCSGCKEQRDGDRERGEKREATDA